MPASPLRDAELEILPCTTTTGAAYFVPVRGNDPGASAELVSYLRECFAAEIDAKNTYPHDTHMNDEEFRNYWFGYMCILLLKDSPSLEGRDWREDILGTYYIKPNYIGHCSHICNAGFLVPVHKRAHKYGKVLARSMPHFASRLGYRSSVFNLVFESNAASIRLWDQYGYRRVGRVEGAISIDGKWIAALVYQGNFLDGSVQTTFVDEP